jgi:hypothetical protein
MEDLARITRQMDEMRSEIASIRSTILRESPASKRQISVIVACLSVIAACAIVVALSLPLFFRKAADIYSLLAQEIPPYDEGAGADEAP